MPNSKVDTFPGFTYNILSREYEWFNQPPISITPFQLIKWAIHCAGWSIHDDETHGHLSWLGPAGSSPWIGSYPVMYANDDVALQAMRAHYAHWWTQREMVKKAFELLEAKVPEKRIVTESPPDFKIPDDTDPPKTEED